MARTPTKSIATRLTMMNMLVSAVALLLACAGFFVYDQVTFRESLVGTLSAQAQIIGSNSVSAILFNDPQAAANTLAALKNSRNVLSAGIFTENRRPLAEYSRDTDQEAITIQNLPPEQIEGYWFLSTHVVLVRQIMSEGKPVGFVYLRAGLEEMDKRLERYGMIAFAVLLISLFAAILASSAFRKSVAQPIIELAQIAQKVSRDKDYTTRLAPTRENDEVAVLVDSFNEMLIELRKSHDELEQRVAERTRELVSANRELEAFSYSVSHDLRGPLDALNGFSYVLLKQHGAKLDDQAREIIDHIRASGKRMAQLIDDLLNLSRVTTSVMRAEKVDLSAIARSIMEELCRNALGRKIEFIAPEKEDVQGDPHLLRIVMENLLRNAWKYTSRRAEARIEFGHSENLGRTIYFVRDDGSGFDQAFADRLFQPFQRLHAAADFPGNGVGLATVRRIIQRHRGEVWAQGAVEKGATFYFTIGSGRGDDADTGVAKNPSQAK
ncbi:MAG: ATP-binding protein [Candidatus Sulfotelmatobacter sp.]